MFQKRGIARWGHGSWVWVVALAACTWVGNPIARAADQPPATQPAAVSQDDPKPAARAFANALGRGDAATAKSLCNGGADDAKFIDAITAMINSVKKFNEALVAKFGDAAKLPSDRNPAQQLIDEIDRSDVKIDHDHATLSRPGDPNPLTLIKIEGQWKIAALAPPAQLRQGATMFNATAQAATEIAADVAAGKYASLEESRAALDARRKTAIEALLNAAAAVPPTTAPTAAQPSGASGAN